MERVVEVFRSLLAGEMVAADAPERLQRLMPGMPCDGYWLGKAGLEYAPGTAA
jgi:hypothetical protein